MADTEKPCGCLACISDGPASPTCPNEADRQRHRREVERFRSQLDALTESAGRGACADEMRKANARIEKAEAENAKLREELADVQTRFMGSDRRVTTLLEANIKLREEAVTLAGRVEASECSECGHKVDDHVDGGCSRTITVETAHEVFAAICPCLREQSELEKTTTPHLQLVRAAMELAKAVVSHNNAASHADRGVCWERVTECLDAYRKAEEECNNG